jgi:uncharacterized protein
MKNHVDLQTGIEWLDRDECLRLLAGDTIGRLAVVVGRTPTILPVNYTLDGDVVVFRSDPGTKVDHGVRAPVSFEVDDFDRIHHTGWSVVVTGRLEEPPPHDTGENSRVHALAIEPWAGGPKDHWLRIIPTRITGRRLGA